MPCDPLTPEFLERGVMIPSLAETMVSPLTLCGVGDPFTAVFSRWPKFWTSGKENKESECCSFMFIS